MNRLPGYDHRTGRSELAAFSSLGLVGAALIGSAFFDSMRFAQERDCIVATLSGGSADAVQVAACGITNHPFTEPVANWGWDSGAHLSLNPVSLTLPYKR